MRSPLCPLNCIFNHQRKKMRPLIILCTPFLWKWLLHADRHTHCVVGTGQGCGAQMGRLTSENSLSKAQTSYTSLGETTNEKGRGPSQNVFFPFQGKMPGGIKTASTKMNGESRCCTLRVKRGESRGECPQKCLKEYVVY